MSTSLTGMSVSLMKFGLTVQLRTPFGINNVSVTWRIVTIFNLVTKFTDPEHMHNELC